MNDKDFEELRQLVEFLKASGIAEFEMERPEMKVRLNFASEPSAAPVATLAGLDVAQLARLMAAQSSLETPAAQTTAPAAGPGGAVPSASEPAAQAEVTASAHIVKSPIVGTFYDAPSPDADSYVRIGDRVSSGQVLCIVEAMKLMNEVESDADGEIVKVLVKPGQPVEYGQALFEIRQ